jgi:hypothetical protein
MSRVEATQMHIHDDDDGKCPSREKQPPLIENRTMTDKVKDNEDR